MVGTVSTHLIPRHILKCDNTDCPAVFGLDDIYESPADVRMGAYNAGWRFPPTTTQKGLSFSVLSDACPDCAPAWVPVPARGGSKSGYLTQAQLAQLRARRGTAEGGAA